MKLSVQHPNQEECAFSLKLEYCVPARKNTHCMSLYDFGKDTLSLHHLLEINDIESSLPSLLVFERGDTIKVFNGRVLTVKKGFSLPINLGYHKHLIFEIVNYYIMGRYLKKRNEDPDFFIAFKAVFSLSGAWTFTKREIKKNTTETQLFGDRIENYFRIETESREIFLKSIGDIID